MYPDFEKKISFHDKAEELIACKPALKWLRKNGFQDDLVSAWDVCERGDWMLWMIDRGMLPMLKDNSRLARALRSVAREFVPEMAKPPYVSKEFYDRVKTRRGTDCFYSSDPLNRKEQNVRSAFIDLFAGFPDEAIYCLATRGRRRKILADMLRKHITSKMVDYHFRSVCKNDAKDKERKHLADLKSYKDSASRNY
jgi:hypothetical protein